MTCFGKNFLFWKIFGKILPTFNDHIITIAMGAKVVVAVLQVFFSNSDVVDLVIYLYISLLTTQL